MLNYLPFIVGLLVLLSRSTSVHSIASISTTGNRTISEKLFYELEELSRLVGIAYCVGYTGIQKPFNCLSWCDDFDGFELVTTWGTGIFDPNSCGYMAVSHPAKRIVVAFRGTNSFSDTLLDLLTAPVEYVPYPSDDASCTECAVHAGFWLSWESTKKTIVPTLEEILDEHPDYRVELLGHSLGGAVAGLAALDFRARGWNPTITTFGEPRFGNQAMADYVDEWFPTNETDSTSMYRRVTHIRDPVPLLPSSTVGWRMHASEVYISKGPLPPEVDDVEHCNGGSDSECIDGSRTFVEEQVVIRNHKTPEIVQQGTDTRSLPRFPGEWRLWELMFAHRGYFNRLGLCYDPQSWNYSHHS